MREGPRFPPRWRFAPPFQPAAPPAADSACRCGAPAHRGLARQRPRPPPHPAVPVPGRLEPGGPRKKEEWWKSRTIAYSRLLVTYDFFFPLNSDVTMSFGDAMSDIQGLWKRGTSVSARVKIFFLTIQVKQR